ncbi:hypothetical protein [Pseudobacillus badius]|uniref:hypothetical protein n=1 Tax=Bacillus badius TaxID=1455 RepID=UPI000A83AAE6|nr:hypothetical protein B0G66_1362 [Bacillus badius]
MREKLKLLEWIGFITLILTFISFITLQSRGSEIDLYSSSIRLCVNIAACITIGAFGIRKLFVER